MALWMRDASSALTGADRLMAADTVASDTRAVLATSTIVGFLSKRFGMPKYNYTGRNGLQLVQSIDHTETFRYESGQRDCDLRGAPSDPGRERQWLLSTGSASISATSRACPTPRPA